MNAIFYHITKELSYWGGTNQPSIPSWQPNPTQPTQPRPTQPSQPVQPQPRPTQPTLAPSGPISPSPRQIPRPSPHLTSAEQQLIRLVNEERARHGLHPLQVDQTLVRFAKDKSRQMATNRSVTHGSRLALEQNLRQASVSFVRVGENIAQSTSVEGVHRGLLNSTKGHRDNILSSTHTHIGVGIVQYGTSYYATQLFIQR